MIPIKLSLSGFLSYRDPVEIDFTSFELACIAGANGAGKSSLLDAITWALFGQARKRDDSVINTQSSTAEVGLVFSYEGNVYHVQRAKPREKTAMLEFHILQSAPGTTGPSSVVDRLSSIPAGTWKPLTERTLRATEARIQDTLRMDYETFTNASFFLQGKADQFTQQRSGDRKRILSSILGLEVWEKYRQRAGERRRALEAEISGLDGRLAELLAELAEEDARKQRLKELEEQLERLSQQRATQEDILANMRQFAARLEEQQRLVDTLARQLDKARAMSQDFENRLADRRQDQASYADMLARSEEIERAYQSWMEMRDELGRLESTASRFREYEKRREGPRAEIQAARARLEGELQSLREEQEAVQGVLLEIEALLAQVGEARATLSAAEARLARREELVAELSQARQRLAEARTENPRLKDEMDEIKARIDELAATDRPECPLCGQPLSADERARLVEGLKAQGTQMGDRYRENQALLRDADRRVAELEAQIAEYVGAQEEVRAGDQHLAGLSSRLELLEVRAAAWQAEGEPRMGQIEQALEKETYAPEARQDLAEIDAELKEIGYDTAAHDKLRQSEAEARSSEVEIRTLEKAQATLVQLEREIAGLEAQLDEQQAETARQEVELQEAQAALESAQAQMPDLENAERDFLAAQEQENRLRLEVGAASQEVLVLADLKARRVQLEAQREALAEQVSHYRQLERSFGKDGVPALLIEQALPEIETRANEVLERLSGGNMSVRFVTQAEYKDKKREDLRETLDIRISDSVGTRDYEMYSGGEAFRVNFAIRLALSEVLAQRAGARLQMLVIDEGFGSQDAQGRQRLVEAINLVKADFAKILVITHIDELKDAFPNRIEVTKTGRGSVVQVI
jgi:exonuclease SbcC